MRKQAWRRTDRKIQKTSGRDDGTKLANKGEKGKTDDVSNDLQSPTKGGRKHVAGSVRQTPDFPKVKHLGKKKP